MFRLWVEFMTAHNIVEYTPGQATNFVDNTLGQLSSKEDKNKSKKEEKEDADRSRDRDRRNDRFNRDRISSFTGWQSYLISVARLVNFWTISADLGFDLVRTF